MRGSMSKLPVVAAVFCCVVFLASRSEAKDPDYLIGAVGGIEVFDAGGATTFGLEYRSGYDLIWGVKPFAGIMGSSDSAIYGFAGVHRDFKVGLGFVVTPNVAVGYFEEGDGVDLDHKVEFRSGIEVAYEFSNAMRLGIGFYHISNAGIGDSNPGTEILSLMFSFPLGGGR